MRQSSVAAAVSRSMAPPAAGISRRVVVLLTLATFINFIDRGNLSTAVPLIRAQFSLTNAQLGVLLSAFFWSYTPGQLPAGWLAERVDARKVLAVGLALWGGATFLTGFVGGVAMLLLLRVLLGLGERAMYPATFKILAGEALESQRGRANGALCAGVFAGPAVGTLLGGLLMAAFGWRSTFVVFGAVSLLWLLPWLTTPRSAVQDVAAAAPSAVPVLTILARPELWGSCLGHFCIAYNWYVVLTWLPAYLVKERGFSISGMAYLGAALYGLAAVTALLAGVGMDRWLARGADTNRVRKSALVVGCAALAAGMAGCALAGPLGSLIALAACTVSLSVVFPAFYATAQTLAGPAAAARWMGVQNFCGNFAGITAPVVTGLAVDRTGGFAAAFLIAA
ncbi:MAG TPA: MFS transporter, partial [Candidatus Dormibacteraeota bacterium]|nr:MFS transporter [Candidatus Dormibacteraeota bacterium]